MKMDFVVVIQLLKQSDSLLKSGYLAFFLSFVVMFLHVKIAVFVPLLGIFALLFVHHFIFSRVQFDRGLLQYLIENGTDIEKMEILTQQLDQSLLGLKLIPINKTNRDWSIRFQGCLKLLKIQIMVVFAQYMVLLLLSYSLLNR